MKIRVNFSASFFFDPMATITLTVRVVKSFEYRNVKTVILHDLDLHTKVSELKKMVLESKGSPYNNSLEIEKSPSMKTIFAKMNLGKAFHS